jgi:hypothetical protein
MTLVSCSLRKVVSSTTVLVAHLEAALNAGFWAQIPQISANKILEKPRIRLKTVDKIDFPRTNNSGILVKTVQNLHNLAPTQLVSTVWGSSSLSVNLHSQWTPLCLAV